MSRYAEKIEKISVSCKTENGDGWVIWQQAGVWDDCVGKSVGYTWQLGGRNQKPEPDEGGHEETSGIAKQVPQNVDQQ